MKFFTNSLFLSLLNSKLILERYYDEISEGLKEKVINQSESTDQFESTYVMLCKKLEEQEEE